MADLKAAGRELGLVVIGSAEVALQADGPLAQAPLFRRTQTGDALLTAISAARLGTETALVARVGNDAFGDWLIESWEAEHLHLDYVREVPGRNALTLLGADADDRQILTWHERVAQASLDVDDVEGIPWDMVGAVFAPGSAQALGPRPRAAIVAAFAAARAAGVLTAYDPTARAGLWADSTGEAARLAFEALTPLTELLVIAAPYATGTLLARPDPEEAAREARRRGIENVVVRHGLQACVVADRRGVRRVEGPDAPERRHTGSASAAFDGGLLAGLCRGLPLAEACAVALETVALAIGGPGHVDSLPWLDQLNTLRHDLGQPPLET